MAGTSTETEVDQPETGDLRGRNRELTRGLIIEAYAELSLARGFNNFTMQDIADRVGISHRTLYRYFENREAIVEGLEAEITAEVFGPNSDTSMDRSEILRHNYMVFGQYRKPMIVYSLMIEAGMLTSPGRSSRTEYVRRLVDEGAPHMSDLGRRQVVGLLRVVAGSMAWARLTSEEIGLSDDDAGAASEWALKTLVEAASLHERKDLS